MKTVLDVVAGARPNFMKIAPILRALEGSRFESRLVHTGQHYDEGMSDVFFRQLGIRTPDVSLGVGSGSHGDQTARILSAYEKHLIATQPKGVIVVGDVNSTMACTIAASKLRIPVAHVEAGLRSLDRTMPEEINRLVTDAIADLLFVSEPAGEENLRKEGTAASRIHYVGNVMIDTLLAEVAVARTLETPQKMKLPSKRYAYLTLHRPSNVDDPERLGHIVALLETLARQVPLAFPVHPRTRGRLESAGLTRRLSENSAIRLLEPLGYRESLALMDEAQLILTDSGGIQEEATQLGIPCLTLRSNTERPITITEGTNTLVGDDLSKVMPLVESILAGRYKVGRAIRGWDGRAAVRIVDIIDKVW